MDADRTVLDQVLQSQLPLDREKLALRLLRLAHLLGTIFSCTTSMIVSFLHFGQ